MPLLVVIAAACLLSACGFRPLYGENAVGERTASELSRIQLNTRNDRIDYLVRTNLQKVLQTGSTADPAHYELRVRLTERREALAIEEDTSITRFNLRLLAAIELKDLESNTTLFSDTARSIAAYNVVDSQFATLAAERNAEERAALDLSDEIKLRLSVYFDRRLQPGRLDPEDTPATEPEA